MDFFPLTTFKKGLLYAEVLTCGSGLHVPLRVLVEGNLVLHAHTHVYSHAIHLERERERERGTESGREGEGRREVEVEVKWHHLKAQLS